MSGSAFLIRRSTEKDFDRLMEIYASAREFMARQGNPHQWGDSAWPPPELIRQDIASGRSYVCEADGRIVGTFCFITGPDVEPTYRVIEDGAWIDDGPYGVIHRLAGDGSVKGVARFCLDWAYGQCGHLRVDTTAENKLMIKILQEAGFVRCGVIRVARDGSARLAFERSGLG